MHGTLGIGVLLSGLCLFSASIAEPFIPPFTADLLQGGALLTLSWTVFHLLTRTFPAHLEALSAQRKDFLDALKNL